MRVRHNVSGESDLRAPGDVTVAAAARGAPIGVSLQNLSRRFRHAV
jgi:hypothetical protein